VGKGDARRNAGANNHSPCNLPGATRRKTKNGFPPGDGKTDARRSKETPRHSGLDPESRIVNFRREAPQDFLLFPCGKVGTAAAIGDSADFGIAMTMAMIFPLYKTNKPETSGFSLVMSQNYTDARRTNAGQVCTTCA
jgi:hypothetical protein